MDFKLFYLLAIIVAISPTFVISELFTSDDKIYLDDQVVTLEGSKPYGEQNGKLYGRMVERELNTYENIQPEGARLMFEEPMEQRTENLNVDMAMKRNNYRDVSKMKRDMAKYIKKINHDAYQYKRKIQNDAVKMNRELTRDMFEINQDTDFNRNNGRKNIKKNQRRAKENMNYDADKDMNQWNQEMDQYTSPKKGRKNHNRNKNVYRKQGMVGNNSGNVFNSNNVVNSDTGFNMDSLNSDMQNNVSETIDGNLEGDMGGKKSRKTNNKNRKNNKKSRKNNKKNRKNNTNSRKNNKKNKRTANMKFVKTPNGMYDDNSGNNNVVTSIDDVNSNNVGNTVIVDPEQNMINAYQDKNTVNNSGNTVITDTNQNIINAYQDMNTVNNSGNTVITDTNQNIPETNLQFVGQDSSKTYTDVDNTNLKIVKNTIDDNMLTVVDNNNLDNSNNNDAGKSVDNIVSISNGVNNNNDGVGKVVDNIVSISNGVNNNNNNNGVEKVVENIVNTVGDENSNNIGTITVDTKQNMNPEINQNMAEINKTGKINKNKRGQIITRRVIVKKYINGNNKGNNVVNDNNVVETTINEVNTNNTGDAVTVDPVKNMVTMNDGYIQEDIDNKTSKKNIKKKVMAKKERVITTNNNTGNNFNVNVNKDVYNDNNLTATIQ